jgi:hypothetical protein
LISCKREWDLPRMNRPDPMPGRGLLTLISQNN